MGIKELAGKYKILVRSVWIKALILVAFLQYVIILFLILSFIQLLKVVQESDFIFWMQ